MARQQDQLVLDDAIRQRLVAMTTDFKKLWNDPSTPNRERKRLLAYIIEDATLIKLPAEGITQDPRPLQGWQDRNTDDTEPQIIRAAGQNDTRASSNWSTSSSTTTSTPKSPTFSIEQGLRPGGSARPGRSSDRFTALRVAYLVHQYSLRSRYNRLRDRGMLTKAEAATRLGIHEATVVRWAEHGIVTRHAYNAHAYLYEVPDANLPAKHCGRWHTLIDRAKIAHPSKPSDQIERGVV